MNFSGKFGDASTIWYPAAGERSGSDGALYDVGGVGRCWSVTPVGFSAYYLYFGYNGVVDPSCSNTRSSGQSVRCLKISEIDGDNEGFGDSYYEW